MKFPHLLAEMLQLLLDCREKGIHEQTLPWSHPPALYAFEDIVCVIIKAAHIV